MKFQYLVYARKSNRHNWRLYGRSHNYGDATIRIGCNLLKDCKLDNDNNWQVRIVTTDINRYPIPDNLKPNINWLDENMITLGSMQSKPDQSIYNGELMTISQPWR